MSFVRYLYIGNFESDAGGVRFAKSSGSPFMKPIVRTPIRQSTIDELLQNLAPNRDPGEVLTTWKIANENGYLMCDEHALTSDAIRFLRLLEAKAICQIVDFTGSPISADKLELQ